MSKLKSSFRQRSSQKLPTLSTGGLTGGGSSRSAGFADGSLRKTSLATGEPGPRALSFGTMHTKASSGSQSGSNWTGLLKSATNSATGVLSDGLLSASGVGLIVKLFGLFGGGKASPPALTQFQSPVQKQNSMDIGTSGSTSSVALGVHPLTSGSSAGVYQTTGVFSTGGTSQSSEVIQIVKLALLTSSTLNDVISEI